MDLDVLGVQGTPDTHPDGFEYSLRGDGQAVTGIQKAVQRYALILLTETGTVLHDSDYGTSFWEDVIRGARHSEGHMRTAFEFANSDALTFLRREDETVDTPPDERIVDAEMLDFDVDTANSSVYIRVKITTDAGESYEYKAPVKVINT